MRFDFVDDYVRFLKELGEHRTLRRLESPQGPEPVIDGKKILSFCCDDYLGLSQSPKAVAKSKEALRRFGVGSGASRLLVGNLSIQTELEEKLALFKGTEAALLFNSGYQANVGVIPALAGEGSVIFCDEKVHISTRDGCRLAEAETHFFRHNDLEDLETLFKKHVPKPGGRSLVLTESVFNERGDLCPYDELLSLVETVGALLYVDECHGFGVFGEFGEGVVPRHPPEFVISMGTLSKALGSGGAFVATAAKLKDYFINRAWTFVFSTSMPPAVVGGSLGALEAIQKEPERRERLWKNINAFSSSLMRPDSPSSIFFVAMDSAEKSFAVWLRLMEEGILVQDIRAGLRIAVTASHTPAHLDRLLEAICRLDHELS